MTINVSDFGTLGTADDAPVFQAAFDYAVANNVALRGPESGEFNLGSTVSFAPVPAGVIGPGLVFECGGASKVKFNNLHSGPAFSVDTGVNGKFMRSGHLSGFTVSGSGKGMTVRRAWQHTLHDIVFTDIPVGLHVPTLAGDPDACNKLALDKVDFFNCSSWGLHGEVASGKNELSFLSLRNVGFQNCGTATGAIGGGMYWRGQQLHGDMVSFTECKNRGLYVEGGAGLGGQVKFVNSSWENGTGKQVEIWGGANMSFDTCDFYSTAIASAFHMWVNCNNPLAKNIEVNRPKVRCSAAFTPHYAFYANLSGYNCRVLNPHWDLYGAAGQVQMTNFTA